MVRKQLVLSAFASLAGMLGYSTVLPAGPLATVTDSNANPCVSENSTVDLLNVEAAQVTLKVNGSCAGTETTTPSGLADLTTRAVDEGTSITLDLGLDVIVKLPYELTASKSVLGQTPTVVDSKLTYWAPYPGTVSDAGGEDSFEYTIMDNSGNHVTKTVTVPINSIEPVVVLPGGDDCVASTTVECKGQLSEWPAGTLVRVSIGMGITQVYHFDYYKDINTTGLFALYDGGLKTVSVSLNANDFSLGFPCQITQEVPEQALGYAPVGAESFGECPLEDGKRYYLNIKSTLSSLDVYSLTVR